MTLPTYESVDTMTGIVIDESVFFIDGFGKKGKRDGFNNVNNAADGRLTLMIPRSSSSPPPPPLISGADKYITEKCTNEEIRKYLYRA